MTEPLPPPGSSDDPMIGRVVKHRYRLERALGRGEFGVAYLAIDQDEPFARATSEALKVVVKVPLPERIAAANGAIPEDFSREASRLSSLKHAHIVKVLDFGFEGATPLLVVEYATGGSLTDRLDKAAGRTQSPEEVLSWLPDVARALDYASGQDVIHRDVSPSNILFDEGGSALLADFGMAKVFGGTSETTGSLPGSHPSLAPDAMLLDEAKGFDGRYDQYALAVTVCEALSGCFPCEPKTWGDGGRRSLGERAARALLHGKTKVAPTPILTFVGHIDERTWAPLSRALSRDRDERFPSCVAFADAFRDAVRDAIQPSVPPLPPARAPNSGPEAVSTPANRTRGRFYVALAILAMAGGVGAALRPALFGSKGTDGGSGTAGRAPPTTSPDADVPVSQAPPLGSVRPIETPYDAFLKDFATSVGTEIDATTGYPKKIRRLKDDGEMVLIPAGTFQMGAVPGDGNASADEKPRHAVTLTKAYYLDVSEVTVGQWKKFVSGGQGRMPTDLPSESTDRHPIHSVDHTEMTAFATWAGAVLPTEAQWERAAKGGHDEFVYPWGTSDDVKKRNGIGSEDGFDGLAPVRTYLPNEYGLYDMSGNVWEWCSDWYDSSYYPASPIQDPSGPSSGTARAARGGSWYDYRVFLRASTRGCYEFDFVPSSRDDDLGFRLARSL